MERFADAARKNRRRELYELSLSFRAASQFMGEDFKAFLDALEKEPGVEEPDRIATKAEVQNLGKFFSGKLG